MNEQTYQSNSCQLLVASCQSGIIQMVTAVEEALEQMKNSEFE